MIDVINTARNDRKEKPFPEGILILLHHVIYGLDLSVLNKQIIYPAGNNGY
jgi:hypothetical protein